MVPSWTETLIKAGVNVVGRTRYCIHPENEVKNISIVGGTKDWDIEKVKELRPDIIILDKEENPKFMSEQNICNYHASHIESLSDVANELTVLSNTIKNNQLRKLSTRWNKALKHKPPYNPLQASLENFPGILEVGNIPSKEIKTALYLIWKNPWMTVGQDTFIGSVLEHINIKVEKFVSKYPEINLESYNCNETLLIFSSEPYPFSKRKDELEALGFPFIIVDGECYSWFGIRTLEFIENL